MDGTLQQNDDLNEASRQFHGNDGGSNQEEELLDDDEDDRQDRIESMNNMWTNNNILYEINLLIIFKTPFWDLFD